MSDRIRPFLLLTASLSLLSPAGARDVGGVRENTFVVLIPFNDSGDERVVQPAWTAHQGTMTPLKPEDHRSVPASVYVMGRNEQATAVTALPRKVQVSCFEFEGKIVKRSSDKFIWATTEPLTVDFSFVPKDEDALRARVINEAKARAKEGLIKAGRRGLSVEATVLGFFDLDKDGTPEIPVHVKVELGAPLSYEIIGPTLELDGVVWFRASATGAAEILFNGLQDWKGWPLGARFHSVADFDSDGFGEVAMAPIGGESGSSLELYELRNGRLEAVLRTESVGGC